MFPGGAQISRRTLVIAASVLTALILAFLFLVVWGPILQATRYHGAVLNGGRPDIVLNKELFEIENESRRTIVQIGFGAFGGLIGGLLALYFTWLRTQAQQLQASSQKLQASVAEQNHFTDRFTRAIEQLGSIHTDGRPKIEVRLGAIYSLERLARDSEKDHRTIIAIMCAYVRENAPVVGLLSDEGAYELGRKLRTDVQAALTVIGRRERDEIREPAGIASPLLDLRSTDLRGAELGGVHFEGANLQWARLEGSILVKAHLEGAIFHSAHLERAILHDAHLQEAALSSAYLRGAILAKAHLEKAWLSDARLDGANLLEAHLEHADISGASLVRANLMRACMEGVFLFDADLTSARLTRADLRAFRIVEGRDAFTSGENEITIAQVKSAQFWEAALWSRDARSMLGLPPESEEKTGAAGAS